MRRGGGLRHRSFKCLLCRAGRAVAALTRSSIAEVASHPCGWPGMGGGMAPGSSLHGPGWSGVLPAWSAGGVAPVR